MSDSSSLLPERFDLEKKYALWLFALLSSGSVAYSVIQPDCVNFTAILVLSSVVGAATWSMTHYVLFNPIRRLVIMARAVGSGDFSKRLGFDRKDDIGSIAFEMDAMCDQLQAAQVAAADHIAALDQLRHSDRIATLGRLASSVAHELGNPLNVIELRAQLIASGDIDTLEQAQKSALVIIEQTRRMTHIIGEILSFARMQPAKLTRLDLVTVVRQAIVLSDHTSKRHETRILLAPPKTAMEINGDAGKLLQIMVNLLVNAVQAMPRGGVVDIDLAEELCTAAGDVVEKPYVCINVIDHGVGIADEHLPKVFEPFFSTKGAEGGTGLGLSVAQGIAREHDGWITVQSQIGHGTSFKVHLPKRDPRNEDDRAS